MAQDTLTQAAGAVMPQDPAAESSVLSAMIGSPDILQECLVALTEEDFYIPSNRKIFRAIREMFDHNQPVDPVTLADHLKSAGELDRVGGLPALMDLGGNTFALASWHRCVEMLQRDTTLRKIIGASANITALAFDAPEDTKEVVDQAERLLQNATDRDLNGTYTTLEEAVTSLYNELGELCNVDVTGKYVETGFGAIDEKLLGLRPGQMIVIGARPGVGKTSFALSLATNAAAAGANVAFFSLEMSRLEIAQRLLSAQAGVSLTAIRSANIKNDEWQRLLQATNDLSELNIMIDDTPGTTVTEVRAKARRMLRGKEKGIVILDYLQLVSPPPGGRRADSRATEVSEMSRGIKIMAKDLGVPVVALSQLNRGVESRTGGRAGGPAKRPQLSDLRESGSIEQDADIVILLDRSLTPEEAEREDRPAEGVTQFIIAKNRSGPLGIVDLVFLPGSTKFVTLDPYHDE